MSVPALIARRLLLHLANNTNTILHCACTGSRAPIVRARILNFRRRVSSYRVNADLFKIFCQDRYIRVLYTSRARAHAQRQVQSPLCVYSH